MICDKAQTDDEEGGVWDGSDNGKPASVADSTCCRGRSSRPDGTGWHPLKSRFVGGCSGLSVATSTGERVCVPVEEEEEDECGKLHRVLLQALFALLACRMCSIHIVQQSEYPCCIVLCRTATRYVRSLTCSSLSCLDPERKGWTGWKLAKASSSTSVDFG